MSRSEIWFSATATEIRSAAAEFRAVLDRSSFLVDGEQAGGRGAGAVALADGAVIEVLPPFAGG